MKRRVYAYIDGFNLYYGAVKGKPYKWLDLVEFSKRLMGGNSILKVKYFTSIVQERGDLNRPSRQQVFWNALRTLHNDKIEIIKGRFQTGARKLPKACLQPNGRYVASPTKSALVMKTVEKGSDVNLAVHLVNDAWQDLYDAALVVSNDSDLVEALSIVKNDCHKQIVLANPLVWSRTGIAAELSKLNLETRKIREEQLIACQLPNQIPGTKIFKPPNW